MGLLFTFRDASTHICHARIVGDWETLLRVVDANRFNRDFQGMMLKAHAEVGEMYVRAIKRGIKQRKYTQASGVTPLIEAAVRKGKRGRPRKVASKMSKTPLIGKSKTLWKSIKWRTFGWDTLAVGIFRDKSLPGGANIVTVATRLHKGYTIKITPTEKMQRFIRFLHSKGVHIKATTRVIVVPGRPFLSSVFGDKKLNYVMVQKYLTAASAALMLPAVKRGIPHLSLRPLRVF